MTSQRTWSPGMRSAVVDACVAKSATEGNHPYSGQARSALMQLQRSKAHVLFSESVIAEWQRHASAFSVRWRAAMESRGLAIRVKDRPNRLLRKMIRNTLQDSADVAALLKDVHLLELAISYTCAVISSDNRSGRLAAEVAAAHDPIKRVQWISPHTMENQCHAWIEGGLVDSDVGILRDSQKARSRIRPRQGAVVPEQRRGRANQQA